MLYVGLPLEYDECARLLIGNKIPEGVSFHIDTYLKNMKSKLRYYPIDKGFNILGFEVYGDKMSVENLCILLLSLKSQFVEEMKSLKIDLSRVSIARMEEEPEIVENPSPMALLY